MPLNRRQMLAGTAAAFAMMGGVPVMRSALFTAISFSNR